MFSFQKLTYDQYQNKLNENNGTIKDGIFIVMDKGKIFIHNSLGSVTTFSINIKNVDNWDNIPDLQEKCIYYNPKTKQQRIWAKNGWLKVNIDQFEQKIKTLNDNISNSDTEAKLKQRNIQINIPLSTPLVFNKAVRTLDDLKEIKISDVQSKNLVLVQTRGLYVYDAHNTKEQDKQKNILIPNEISKSIPGRWIKLVKDNKANIQNRDVNFFKIKMENNQKQKEEIREQEIEKGISILKEKVEKEKDITEKAVKWFVDKNNLFNSSDDSSFSSNFDYDGIM